MADDDARACSGCGCTDTAPCAGGCGWLPMGTLCSRCFEAGRVGFDLPLLLVTAIHGSLLLALRHPAYTGPSRALVEDFVAELEEQLVELGALTPDEVTETHRVEAAESPRIILARG